jgi:hypothetical protein
MKILEIHSPKFFKTPTLYKNISLPNVSCNLLNRIPKWSTNVYPSIIKTIWKGPTPLPPCTIQTTIFLIGKFSIIDGYEKKLKESANIGWAWVWSKEWKHTKGGPF